MTIYLIRRADSLYCVNSKEKRKKEKKSSDQLKGNIFKICNILYQFINETLCTKKSVKRIRKGRILFEKFDILINLLRKLLGSSSNEKKNRTAHLNIQK